MNIKAVSKNLTEFVQLYLDKEYGEGKSYASEKGTIKFCFPTTHHGCNEMDVGTWKLNKNQKVTIVLSLDYVEAYEHLKSGTKPMKDEVIALAPDAFEFPKGRA